MPRGNLSLILTIFGALLIFEDGTQHPPSVELQPADLDWLAAVAHEAAALHTGGNNHEEDQPT